MTGQGDDNVANAVERIVIVGAGQAGGEAAQRLRAGGFSGDLTLIGDEPLPPYQRPPLSKKYLSGDLDADRLLLRTADVYEAEGVSLRLNRKVIWIDRAQRRVRLEGGQELPYDVAILATGSRARALPLPGADLPGVFTLRTAADVDAIRGYFKPGAKLAVIGAGYIGLEVAAVAQERGLDVTVIEAAARPLARVAGPEIAGFFLDAHVAAGVRFLLSATPVVIKGADGVRAVGLADGEEVEADLVIAGIGINPEVSLAEKAQLEVANGIVVDRAMRTSDPNVFAIGDCVCRPVSLYDRMCRLESVHNAIEGAKIASATILGQPAPAEETPWFWSDQYDLKLTIAGLSQGCDRTVVRGDMASRAFSVFSYKGDRLLAVDAVNRPVDYLGGKQILQRGQTVAPELVADLSVSMKDIAAAARAA